MPAISIIMPCYNAVQHLSASTGSVLAQTFQDWELIAIDDGSSDETLALLRTHTDPRIRVFTQSNHGVSAARNAGLASARGRYVAFLDADDTWDASFLEKILAVFNTQPDAVLAYCGWQNLGLPNGRDKPFIPPVYEGPKKTESLLGGCRWPIHACLTRLSVIQQVGGFDCDLRIGEDYLLWMEVAQLGSILRVPEVLAFYHHHGKTQATHDRVGAALDTLLAKQKFLAHHPGVAQQLGKDKVDTVTWGKLIEQANALYWQGQLESARPLFMKALRSGRGSLKDRIRMLASLLPIRIQKAFISTRVNQRQNQKR